MKHLLIFILVFIFQAQLFAGNDEHYVIVMAYHSFTGNTEHKTDVSMDVLREQMIFFKRLGFDFVSFSDLFEEKLTRKWNLLVTIDDGNRSVYPAFYSVLKPLGIRPLLGIYPGVIGKSHALTWEMLKKLTLEGCEIASHGYYHRYVDKRLFLSNPLSFKREIFQSKAELEKRLGVVVRAFVYPYGVYSDVTVREIKKAGYVSAFGIRWGVVEEGHVFMKKRYELPRYMFMDNWEMLKRVVKKEVRAGYKVKKKAAKELP